MRFHSGPLGPLALLWVGVLIGACHTTRPPDLPDPDIDLGLGNVVFMTFTTRAPEGVLGHALMAEVTPGGGLNPHRKPIRGKPREVQTDQHLRVVFRTEDNVSVGAGYGAARGAIAANRATHVAYDVVLTSYLEYTPEELIYDAKSGCCVGGERTPGCGTHYVTRLFRGTGSAQLLTELAGSARVDAADILHASGGRAFRKLSESTFRDAFFGYELESLDELCTHLDPAQEMLALEVQANKNCFLTAFTADGKRQQTAWTLPDRDLCAQVLRKACAHLPDAIRCEGRFRSAPQPTPSGESGTDRPTATLAPQTGSTETLEVIPVECGALNSAPGTTATE